MTSTPSFRLCLFGSVPPAPSLLAGLTHGVAPVLVGPWAAQAGGADAVRLSGLPAGTDPLPFIPALAAAFPGESLVLVRTDAELPDRVIDRLLRALACEDVLAAVPLDNVVPARSPLPAGTESVAPAARIDAVCYAYSARGAFDGPVAAAPVSAWRGAALARLDLSQPGWIDAAPAAGLRCVVLDHAYVAAAGTPLTGAPADTDPRDPLPPSPLAALREQVRAALDAGATPGRAALDERPVLLHVLHGWGGGAERWVRDFAASFDGAHHLVLIARGSAARRMPGEWLELHDGALAGPPLRRVALPQPIADTALADAGYRAILGDILADYGVDAIIVSSLIGHSLDALRTGLPTVRIVHDHYPLWPVLHRDFGDPRLAFDAAQRSADLAAATDYEFIARDPDHWTRLRDACVAALGAAQVRLVAPSRAALADDLRLAPELRALPSAVIPHGIAPWPSPPPEPTVRAPGRRLRLLLPGRIRHGKGGELLQAVLPALRERAELFLIGAGTDAHALFGQHGVHILLDYRRDELPELIARIAPDAALLLPTVAETFGYMLSELRSLGVPVLATRIGALAERIVDGVDGFLAAPEPAAVIAGIDALQADRGRLDTVRSTLAGQREPDLAAMSRAYAEVMPTAARPPLRYRPGLLGADRMAAAAAARDLATAARQGRALAADLAATREESARRGDWGHRLDRELTTLRGEFDARTRWALALNEELERIRPVHEQMLASTSWRITAPLRTAMARLRALRAALGYRRARLSSLLGRVRGSIARRGVLGTLTRIARELRAPPPPRRAQVYAAPDGRFAPFAVPRAAAPRVSIVIPVYNKIAYTVACLRSLAEHAGDTPFETIVVDDGSSDDTPEKLAQIQGIQAIRNARNLGFIGSCNAGAAAARGEYVLFLNNDTVVTAGWLEALLRCFAEEPQAGLVGARLVYPDGRLQEAGGIVFDDASGWNYGRFDDPDDPRYAFRREADYCSGAAIMLPRALFERLGRFDARYAPAYYEDTDLAFAVRAAGYRVFYEPASTVVHFEGITSGTDTATGIKRYQVVNQATFHDKWRGALAQQPAPGTPIGRAASHRARGRVLIVDATTPAPDQDSGSLRMVNLMRVLRDLGYQVSFLPDNRAWVPRYTAALQALGVEALYHPYVADPVAWFRARGAEFDAIVLSRHYVASSYVGLARLHAPRARLIFDTVDLHYLREQRAADLEQRDDLARHAAATRTQELRLMRECDVTLVVSPAERALLAVDAPGVRVEILSNVHEVFGCRRPWGERRDLVFVGGFEHPPNADAVLWFVGEVLPRIRARLPDVRLHVVGSKVTPAVEALAGEAVVVHGYVPDLEPMMDGCRVSVAPLRYGAGVKGKVNMAMSYGLPVVATPIAVEGMHVKAGDEVLVAADADAFADEVVRLYGDEALWTRLSENGLLNVREHFSFEAARRAVQRVLS
ncbi:Glycosyltransferase [Dokdonella koreensis DS-123]|uniref:Glycosyltransferase n=2 Tax=Dokdonella TaxID=323413 RepID=A0A160DWL2_9GAMM|nr:glycosyltransferase [Dokdonella koreensis]ANB19017.1 Glycosyltransferase [Dokdonella koreensis DS-123]